MASDALFVYGTLMQPRLVLRLLGWVPAARRARLREYARYRVRGQAYPGVVAEPGARVQGLLYEGLRREDWPRLDDYEGEQYERRTLSVELLPRGDTDSAQLENTAPQEPSPLRVGAVVSARVYVFRSEFRDALSEEPWELKAAPGWRPL